MKKIALFLMSTLLIVLLLPSNQTSAAGLDQEWKKMINQGVVIKNEKGVYPTDTGIITREEFATYISNALKLPSGPNQFNDVNSKSIYAPGINAAAKAGIVNGTTSKTFLPKQNITREQMSLMMNRAMNYLKIEQKTISLTFKDSNLLSSSDSRKAVANMVAYKIILGYPTNEFKPKENAQRNQAAAFINRMLGVAENNTTPTPEPEKDVYTIGAIDSSEIVKPTNKVYKNFEEADKNFGTASNQVISYNGMIVKMNKGIVVAKANSGKETNVYTTAQFQKVKLGMSYGSEMEYVSSNATSIRVNIAGQDGYVKYSEAYLLPEVVDANRTYYSVDDKRNLFLNIYNPISKTKSPQVFYGKAPASFTIGGKYYSRDGVNFTDKNGTSVASVYQYFNVLPFRTTTNYNATELEQIIKNRLASREALYKKDPKGYPQYKDATTKSKLLGLGKSFKEAESKYKLNALMLLAQAIHESDYGMSNKAQNKKNLFGMEVYDSVVDAGKTYANPQDSIADLATSVLNKNYIPADGGYANGANLGNKYRGVNVRYTTDPYWGQKIAGHLYSLDLDMGGKDFINNTNPYKLYNVVSPSAQQLNVRSEPNSSATKLYTYKVMYSVIASLSSEKKSDYTWHKILSDSNDEKYGYVAEGDQFEKFIEPLNIAK
ncbi:S-layer homology domain-containing protein [Bacillus massiliigorillae]|uniref:S-layer homology domain-containing protein n=1 Tax=Bacillus massiliigorillae TaxID=1243664 RepID=UPI0003A3DDF2|nr:S-layer homology domain-containing protein [Bacillus massiliigorillae]